VWSGLTSEGDQEASLGQKLAEIAFQRFLVLAAIHNGRVDIVPLTPEDRRPTLRKGMDRSTEKQRVHQLEPRASGAGEHLVLDGLTKLDQC